MRRWTIRFDDRLEERGAAVAAWSGIDRESSPAFNAFLTCMGGEFVFLVSSQACSRGVLLREGRHGGVARDDVGYV